ncbi:hypothetical protein PQX77_006202, partial [Marasmius sp. AFHP31]
RAPQFFILMPDAEWSMGYSAKQDWIPRGFALHVELNLELSQRSIKDPGLENSGLKDPDLDDISDLLDDPDRV